MIIFFFFFLPPFLLELLHFFFSSLFVKYTISRYAAPPPLLYFPRYIMRLGEELPYSLYFHHISLRPRKNIYKLYICLLRSYDIIIIIIIQFFNLICTYSSRGRKSIFLLSIKKKKKISNRSFKNLREK